MAIASNVDPVDHASHRGVSWTDLHGLPYCEDQYGWTAATPLGCRWATNTSITGGRILAAFAHRCFGNHLSFPQVKADWPCGEIETDVAYWQVKADRWNDRCRLSTKPLPEESQNREHHLYPKLITPSFADAAFASLSAMPVVTRKAMPFENARPVGIDSTSPAPAVFPGIANT